ncbi:hypothetical protein PVAP13_1NG333300 [Panicum virgatum]|uniref:Uncharacterized protein n=1 Tax=Panicum virgatum TaxID=38727 RepID=A0A8T0WWA0_PANVG|nr:hypothetical protein PVAP13_1NG333300 [Panicum virgatum]
MGAREDGVKKDPAAAAAFDEAGDGDLPGAQPVGQAGVDFIGQGSVGLGGGELRPQGLSGHGSGGRDHALDAPAPPGGGLDNAFDAPGPGLGRGSPDGRLTRPLLGAQHVGGAVQAPAGRRGDPHGPERAALGVIEREVQVTADFRRAAGGDRGGMTRHLARLFLLLGAMTTLAGEPGAPWLSQLGALLAWLAGCILLFLSLQ